MQTIEDIQRMTAPAGRNIGNRATPCEKKATTHSVEGRKAISSTMPQRRKADCLLEVNTNF